MISSRHHFRSTACTTPKKRRAIMQARIAAITMSAMTHYRRMIRHVAILALCIAPAMAQVAVSLAPAPRFYAVDSNGNPCVGCLLYSYAAGSSTPQPTYIDSTGTAQNANPITLDSTGSAAVWLSGLAYKLALTTPGGSPLWTVDHIQSPLSQFVPVTGGTFTGPVIFTGTASLNGGGAFAGAFTGAPTLPGAWNFTGSPSFTGTPNFSSWTSLTTHPAASGSIRLANTDAVNWRNMTNTADLSLFPNVNNMLTFNGFASANANPAQTGILALASSDSAPCWRNVAGSADLCISHDDSDDLEYNGHIFALATGSTNSRYSAITPVSVTDTTAPTDLENFTLPAGTLNISGITAHFTAGLYCTNASGSAVSTTITLLAGAVQLLTVNYPALANGTAAPFTIDLLGTVTTIGTSGTMEYQSSIVGISGGAINQYSSAGSGPLTIDTTASQLITVQVTFGTAATTISCKNSTLVGIIQ